MSEAPGKQLSRRTVMMEKVLMRRMMTMRTLASIGQRLRWGRCQEEGEGEPSRIEEESNVIEDV